VVNGNELLPVPEDQIIRLDDAECYARLRQHTLGRIAVKLADDIAILPVYYAVMDEDIVFRAGPGTKLNAAMLKTKVAFEVDDETSPAWSVLVRGHLEEIRHLRQQQRASDLLGSATPAGARDELVRIRAEQVTGGCVRL
jgi:nitroimidazol reductase NimA-like FMN-containing flavoprotein (pyridoxamine 5'-phosphate oxidase superfamily)